MNPEIALKLLQKYVHGETLLRHCKTVGVAMRYFAEKYGESPDYWESVGILHDIDFEVAPDNHCGLIFACAMARPSKSVTDMEVKSVTKKVLRPIEDMAISCRLHCICPPGTKHKS